MGLTERQREWISRDHTEECLNETKKRMAELGRKAARRYENAFISILNQSRLNTKNRTE